MIQYQLLTLKIPCSDFGIVCPNKRNYYLRLLDSNHQLHSCCFYSLHSCCGIPQYRQGIASSCSRGRTDQWRLRVHLNFSKP